MLESFKKFVREESIRVSKKPKTPSTTRHSATHRREPHIAHHMTTGPTGEFDRPVKEEIAMSVGAGDPAKVTDPTTNYASQMKNKLKTTMLRRKAPK